MRTLVLIALLAYLMGSLSFAVIVSRVMGLPDPRTFGSGNPGATNMLRGGSRKAAALVLLGDALKGWLAVWWSLHPYPLQALPVQATAVAALAVFMGHGYPLFFAFRGGKGVATALGILLALQPVLGLGTLLVWLLVMGLTRISSLSALCAALAAPLLGWMLLDQDWLRWTVLALAVILLAHHRANMGRLLRGEETIFRKER